MMEKTIQRPRRNPVAAEPILRKGGIHEKSKTAERALARRQLKKAAADWPQGRPLPLQPSSTTDLYPQVGGAS